MLQIPPNPVSEILQINASEGIVMENATIYSMVGERLIITSEKSVNVSDLSEGIYFIKIVTDKGIVTKKIAKKR